MHDSELGTEYILGLIVFGCFDRFLKGHDMGSHFGEGFSEHRAPRRPVSVLLP